VRRGGDVVSDGDEWATLDELLGMEALADQPDRGGIGRLEFYERCSTEDNQDPATSKAWQLGEAERFVEPLGGEVVEEFFDIGQSSASSEEAALHLPRADHVLRLRAEDGGCRASWRHGLLQVQRPVRSSPDQQRP
jgi:hypothetical protein